MKAKGFRWMCMAATLALLAACGGGPVKRVSEPNAGIQQLTVQADGRDDPVTLHRLVTRITVARD